MKVYKSPQVCMACRSTYAEDAAAWYCKPCRQALDAARHWLRRQAEGPRKGR